MTKPVKLIGKGIHLPNQLITSEQLELQNNWEKGHIFKRHGIKTRYWVRDESNSSMAASALDQALKDANIVYEDLDLLINASATYEYPLPATACFIPQHLDKEDATIPVLDLNSSCLSFLSALEMAGALIACGSHQRIAVVSSEISSKSLNPKNEETICLFGDGAAAFVLGKSDSGEHLTGMQFRTYPKGKFFTHVPAGGNHLPGANHPEVDKFMFHMEGKSVMKFTINALDRFLEEYQNRYSKTLSDFDYIIPHQTSKLSLSYLLKRFNLSKDKVHITLEKYGNCVAASIPMALYDAIEQGKVNRGDNVLLIGTAAGISIGAVQLHY